jgi:hypothetical protein
MTTARRWVGYVAIALAFYVVIGVPIVVGLWVSSASDSAFFGFIAGVGTFVLTIWLLPLVVRRALGIRPRSHGPT